MKKNNILKKIAAATAITLAFVNLVIPRQAELDADEGAGIAVCVIEDDDEERRPLGGTEHI